jgi:hypothetical protein
VDKPATHIALFESTLYGTGMSDQPKQPPSLKDLYPYLTQEELEIAEETLSDTLPSLSGLPNA